MGILGKALKEAGRVMSSANKEENRLREDQLEDLSRIIQSAENGNINAMLKLAEGYINGDVIRYDPKLACYWWTKAAEAGNVDAMYNLGLLYKGDLSNFYFDDEKAIYWLGKAGDMGDMEAREVFLKTFKYSRIFGKWVRK